MKKLIIVIVCVAVVAAMFAGCATANQPAASSAAAVASASTAATTAPSAAEATSAAPASASASAAAVASASPAASASGVGLMNVVPKGPIVVGISTGSSGTSWRDEMISSLKQVGDEYKAAGIIQDYKIVNNTTNGDANEQAQIIRNFVDDPSVNVIMLDPNDATAESEPIAEAEKAGKMVVVFDSTCNAPGTLQVTIDHYAWSKKNVDWLFNTLQSGNVIDIYGLEGHPANVPREQAVTDELKNFPNIHLLQRQSGGWDETKAKTVAAQMIAGGQQIDGVITQDGMAAGVLSAFQDAGKLPKAMFGDPGTQFFKMWNDLRNQKANFKAQTQVNPPGIGGTAFRLAIDLAKGKNFKDGTLTNGSTYYYPISGFYTDDNFDQAWQIVKDQPDSYLINEVITQANADALFQ